jgi:hypothetical protein
VKEKRDEETAERLRQNALYREQQSIARRDRLDEKVKKAREGKERLDHARKLEVGLSKI